MGEASRCFNFESKSIVWLYYAIYILPLTILHLILIVGLPDAIAIFMVENILKAAVLDLSHMIKRDASTRPITYTISGSFTSPDLPKLTTSKHWSGVGSRLGQRSRRWTNIGSISNQILTIRASPLSPHPHPCPRSVTLGLMLGSRSMSLL